MHDADNEIVNSQANMTKANQYSLWHEVYETTGYDARLSLIHIQMCIRDRLNVKAVVDKYGGDMVLSCDEDEFKAVVIL